MSGLAALGLAGFGWLALFQLMLAAGAPLGALAWSGRFRVLPAILRWASLAVAGCALLGAFVVAQAAGWGPRILPEVWLRPALGAFAVLFAMSTLANAASPSNAERLHGVPLTALLAFSCAGLFFA